MKLSMQLNYAGGFKEAVKQVVELEKAGLDLVWVAEAYTLRRHQPDRLPRGEDRAGARSAPASSTCTRAPPALMAMTAAGCDYVSDGRFILGLGASRARR